MFQHHIDIYQTIASAIDKDYGGFNILRGKSRDLVVLSTPAKTKRRLYVVVVHLKAFVAYDLEPVYDTFC